MMPYEGEVISYSLNLSTEYTGTLALVVQPFIIRPTAAGRPAYQSTGQITIAGAARQWGGLEILNSTGSASAPISFAAGDLLAVGVLPDDAGGGGGRQKIFATVNVRVTIPQT